MADVTGPISSLPGAVYKAEGDCDDHPGVPAVKRIQGETDSMGCEMIDMCQECYTKFTLAREELAKEEHACDWCGNMAPLRAHRDYEEGMSGPVYQVCGACIRRESDSLAAEMADSDDGFDYDFGDDYGDT